jgi:hypothetical protein
MSAVASLRRLVKRWSAPERSELACGFPPEGLDAVLALRTSVLNETYDEFWEEQPRLVA